MAKHSVVSHIMSAIGHETDAIRSALNYCREADVRAGFPDAVRRTSQPKSNDSRKSRALLDAGINLLLISPAKLRQTHTRLRICGPDKKTCRIDSALCSA